METANSNLESSQLENFEREKYEEFRKEILNFKELPESFFSEMRAPGDARLLDQNEAKDAYAHGIMRRIDEYFGDTVNDKKRRGLHFELVHLFEKEMYGIEEPRKMYNEDGSEFL